MHEDMYMVKEVHSKKEEWKLSYLSRRAPSIFHIALFYTKQNAISTKISLVVITVASFLSFFSFQYISLLFCVLAEQPTQFSETCFSSRFQMTYFILGLH